MENNDESEEVEKRNSGTLKGLGIGCQAKNKPKPMVIKSKDLYSVKRDIPQNGATTAFFSQMNALTTINVGAAALKDNTKLYLKYWTADDIDNSKIIELENAEITQTTDSYGGKSYEITTQSVLEALILKK